MSALVPEPVLDELFMPLDEPGDVVLDEPVLSVDPVPPIVPVVEPVLPVVLFAVPPGDVVDGLPGDVVLVDEPLLGDVAVLPWPVDEVDDEDDEDCE